MTKNLMIQGTMSNAGKSIITAGILRILRQDGIHAAPFKSQNMALNSFVTKEGLEIGRAQAMQAEAAGLEPLACMNPILLKPTSDTGSQVIVNGKSIGNMPAEEYFRYKKELIPVILEAYRKLSETADVIVIEGAGSPAEINLQENDIVNMGMAKLVDAPVLLVGDIDRGGVFAQLLGTVELMKEEERQRIKGLVINKFRGDPEILKPGLVQFGKYCSIPFAGIVPYLSLDLDEEDSLSERLQRTEMPGRAGQVASSGKTDLAVIRLPHISNYTDFAPFENRPDCHLRYVRNAEEIGSPDLIFLPGTKNTLGDLRWLRKEGLADGILHLAGKGTPVFGICGGYQMMGTEVSDPENTEGGGREKGLALLPMQTVFLEEKMTSQVSGRISSCLSGIFQPLSGLPCRGYEIHMGRTVCGPGAEIFSRADGGRVNGCLHGNAAGTYLHGFFDTAEIADAFLRALCMCRGDGTVREGGTDRSAVHESQYDRLADVLRASLDMELLRKLLEQPQR